MSDTTHTSPQLQLSNLATGFVISRAVQVAAELGLADALAHGPKDRAALAHELGGIRAQRS